VEVRARARRSVVEHDGEGLLGHIATASVPDRSAIAAPGSKDLHPVGYARNGPMTLSERESGGIKK
jgi:hypothetical protein